MPANVTIKIKNINQIVKAWRNSPGKLKKEIHTAIAKTVLKIENESKREAPVNKKTGGGNLRQSISSRMTGTASGLVEVNALYAVFVHEGTRPHTIQAKNRRTLANRRTGEIFGRTVNHPGTRANPFLQRAVDKSEKDIDQYFISAVTNIFK